MSFDAKNTAVRNLFSNNLYRIPRNQRLYVWNKENWKELFNDIAFSVENESSHFLGSIVLKSESPTQGLDTFTIIDGQQRLMTITIFLTVIIYSFKVRKMESDFRGSLKYLMTRDDKNEERHLFQSDYHQSLERIIDSIEHFNPENDSLDTLHSFLDIQIVNPKRDKCVSDCFEFFFISLNEYLSNSDDKSKQLIALRDGLINASFVKIIATSEEDSYTIFEILNARGQSLEDHELIKNFIMRYIQPKENRDCIKDGWNEMEMRLGKYLNAFIKHYAIHKFPPNESLRKDPYKNVKKNVSSHAVDEFYKDVILKSTYYEKIVNPILKDIDDNEICSKLEYDTFRFFKNNRQEQYRPVVLSIMHLYATKKISKKVYEDSLLFLKNFFVCYILIGQEKSNTITDIISRYAYRLEQEGKKEVLDEMLASLRKRLPSEEKFIAHFENIGWSNHLKVYSNDKNKKMVSLIMRLYEQKLKKNSGEIGNFTIEHILPDSEKKEENVKLGNLLPLEEHLNELCANKSLGEKIAIYKKSNFRMVLNFVDRYEGKLKKFNPKSRLEALAKDFYQDLDLSE